MRPILIKPKQRQITTFEVPTQLAAAAMALCKPYAMDDLTSDHVIFYSALAVLGEDRHLFWSKRLGTFICGNALVFGTTVDGFPKNPEIGMDNAMREDVVFLGPAESAIEQIKNIMSVASI